MGQTLLDEKIELSAFARSGRPDYAEFIKTYDPERRDAAIGPNAVPGSKFVVYGDALLKRDIFVLPNSVPLLVIDRGRDTRFGAHPACQVWERVLDDLHLWYWYDRTSFIAPDIDVGATIDARLQQLLGSFPTVTPKQTTCE